MSEQQSETTATHSSVEEYVRYALRQAGVKIGDLDESQRARANDAPKEKAGLRGATLATWIIDGKDAKTQVEESRKEQALARKEETSKRRSDAAKKAGTKPPRKPSPYSDEVRAAVKIANEIRGGKGHGAGPKQHQHVRQVVTAELGGAPEDAGALLAFVGVKRGELFKLADGSVDRTHMKALLPVAEKMGDDPWCKGRHLAAELAAWVQQLETAAKS